MTGYLTDNEGIRYRLVRYPNDFGINGYVLKPIKLKDSEKQSFLLELYRCAGENITSQWFMGKPLELTNVQAEALAKAVEALVEYVQVELATNLGDEQTFENLLIRLARKARKSFQDGES